MNRLQLGTVKYKVKSRLEIRHFIGSENEQNLKDPTPCMLLEEEKTLAPHHKYLCKANLRASNEKMQKLSQLEKIVFKSFGSHEFHDRVLRLKTEVTAYFFMDSSKNL